MNNRILAIKWFKNLTYSEQEALMIGEFEDKSPNTLTGREIEALWIIEVYLKSTNI